MGGYEDLLGDGRLLKRIISEGDGAAVVEGCSVQVHYETRVVDTDNPEESKLIDALAYCLESTLSQFNHWLSGDRCQKRIFWASIKTFGRSKKPVRASRKIKTTGAEGRNQRKKEEKKEDTSTLFFHHNKIVAFVFVLPLFLLCAWAFVPSTPIQCPAAILKQHWNVWSSSLARFNYIGPAIDPVHPGERRCALPPNPPPALRLPHFNSVFCVLAVFLAAFACWSIFS